MISVLMILIAVLYFYLDQSREEGAYPPYLVAILWLIVAFTGLWLGNLVIHQIVKARMPWGSKSTRGFSVQLFTSLLFSLLWLNITYLIMKGHYTELPPDRNQFILLNIYGVLFLIPIISIQFGLLFLYRWKAAVVSQEELEKERVSSELMTLKSHLSPHFMFNNLNVLSSLIYDNNVRAHNFLDKFSAVYRYVLKNRNEELVTLEEEVGFLESFVFLLQNRFSNSLNIDLKIDDQQYNKLLPPLALQMLVENALKHNILSTENPLAVSIESCGADALKITNTLQPRIVPKEDNTGLGLENIDRRYWLIARKRITIEQNKTHFSVTLPLVKDAKS